MIILKSNPITPSLSAFLILIFAALSLFSSSPLEQGKESPDPPTLQDLLLLQRTQPSPSLAVVVSTLLVSKKESGSSHFSSSQAEILPVTEHTNLYRLHFCRQNTSISIIVHGHFYWQIFYFITTWTLLSIYMGNT